MSTCTAPWMHELWACAHFLLSLMSRAKLPPSYPSVITWTAALSNPSMSTCLSFPHYEHVHSYPSNPSMEWVCAHCAMRNCSLHIHLWARAQLFPLIPLFMSMWQVLHPYPSMNTCAADPLHNLYVWTCSKLLHFNPLWATALLLPQIPPCSIFDLFMITAAPFLTLSVHLRSCCLYYLPAQFLTFSCLQLLPS